MDPERAGILYLSGATGTRTLDLFGASEALSQLSYSPMYSVDVSLRYSTLSDNSTEPLNLSASGARGGSVFQVVSYPPAPRVGFEPTTFGLEDRRSIR